MRPILAALALAASSAHAEVACSWNNQGYDPFRGDRIAAVMSYAHIPLQERFPLAMKVRWGKPDFYADITPTGITGAPGVNFSDIAGMHFGRGRRCEVVDRSQWAAGHAEPAAIYRRGNWCAVVPTVCGNVSWAHCSDSGLVASASAAVGHAPEPGTAALVLAALGALVLARRRG